MSRTNEHVTFYSTREITGPLLRIFQWGGASEKIDLNIRGGELQKCEVEGIWGYTPESPGLDFLQF